MPLPKLALIIFFLKKDPSILFLGRNLYIKNNINVNSYKCFEISMFLAKHYVYNFISNAMPTKMRDFELIFTSNELGDSLIALLMAFGLYRFHSL